MASVTIKDLVSYVHFDVLAGANGLDSRIKDDEIIIPGVEFFGYFKYFQKGRLALLGSKEADYLNQIDRATMEERVEDLFKKGVLGFMFSKNVHIDQLFIELGNKYNIPILKSDLRTTPLTSKVYVFLRENLAERIGVHGVLVDINGMGTLIIGKSGIGKSETALELIRRGHQLIADDLVEIYEREVGTLIGTAPNNIATFLEVRGIGIINVVETYGVGAYRQDKTIRLVIELEEWDGKQSFDRLGMNQESVTYFHTELPVIKVPVRTGRNISLVVEAAAMNEKLKYLGYHSLVDLTNRITESRGQKDE